MSVPDWEKVCEFDPYKIEQRDKPAWITLGGEAPSCPTTHPSAEEVLDMHVDFDINSLPIRDPNKFVSGQIHNFWDEWEKIISESSGERVAMWLKNGIDIFDFISPFKGNFRGKHYDSPIPPRQYFPNAPCCHKFVPFICDQLSEYIASGAIKILGKVGHCVPPRIVMPLTVEPSKPRLCHDERFLNLWIKDCPFKLETLRDVHRIVPNNAFMITCDEKSGYSHVRLNQSSQTFFGIQFAGYYLVYTTLPFGWKASAFIYQSIGMIVTSYLRNKSISNTLYIDDRLSVGIGNTKDQSRCDTETLVKDAKRAAYAMVQILSRLGYTLNTSKSSLEPGTSKQFLGFLIDSVKQAYILPEKKKEAFIELRDHVLKMKLVDLKTLQRLCGKCISMGLAVPGTSLFCREINRAISTCSKNSKKVEVAGPLKEEIEHWKFLDSWSGCSAWRPEFHKQVKLYTDSSLYKYGASLIENGNHITLSDFWDTDDKRPIHIKEADAVLKSLESLHDYLKNSRVDVMTDNMAVLGVWQNQGGKDRGINMVMKDIFKLVVEYNIDLHMAYVPSAENPADKPSRSLNYADTMLSPDSWNKVESAYGPHSIDLMSLDSNAMKSENGCALKHFTPYATPKSDGINIFAQSLAQETNMYVFPPFGMILPVLCFLREQSISCTFIAPHMYPAPTWFPIIKSASRASFCIGEKSEKGVLLVPSKNGFVKDDRGLQWSLWAHRISFKT